jgi:acrylyl-CoA reductase (NADPH)
MAKSFRAIVVDKLDNGDTTTSIKSLEFSALPQGDVTINVSWSSVNYKDALAVTPSGNVVRSYPMIPGIDLSGTVEESSSPNFRRDDQVIVTGYGLGVSHFGGFSEYARVPADWVVPLPESMSPREAMTLGTAGFTAALSVYRLEENGLKPDKGSVVVTGASGGVGSIAVALMAHLGYDVAASTGKEASHQYLRDLGAREILSREATSADSAKALEKELWAGAIDPVGGKTLACLLRSTKYRGSVAVCGLTGGTYVPLTVFPFIIRGVNLLGIDSAYCPMDLRREIWRRLADTWKLSTAILEKIGKVITLEQLPQVLGSIRSGQISGRCIVNLYRNQIVRKEQIAK